MAWLFILLAVCAIVGLFKYYSQKDYNKYDVQNLSTFAKPVSVDHKVVGSKGAKKWRTTVNFDDGFKYTTYRTERENHLLSYTISVSEETHSQIIADAKRAHEEALNQKYQKYR